MSDYLSSLQNITKVASDEMWGLDGTDVEIPVVVNFGTGIPDASECSGIAILCS